jgi:hypothetical protein
MITAYVLTKYREYLEPEGWVNDCQAWRDLLAAGLLIPGSAYRDATDDAPTPPTDPNVMVAKLTITQAALDWILASPEYGEGAILYVEE